MKKESKLGKKSFWKNLLFSNNILKVVCLVVGALIWLLITILN